MSKLYYKSVNLAMGESIAGINRDGSGTAYLTLRNPLTFSQSSLGKLLSRYDRIDT
jgi:hypothetical protein